MSGRRDGENFAYLGDRKTGKSTLARKHVLQRGTTREGDVLDGHLLIYVTPNGADSDPWPGPSLTAEELRALCDDDGAEFPPTFAVRGGKPAYELAGRVALDVSPRLRVTLLLDECHRVYRENFSDDSAIAEAFHEGRHRGLDMHFVTQWPARADKRLFRTAEVTYWFHLHEADDMEWIRKRYSVRAAEEVLALPAPPREGERDARPDPRVTPWHVEVEQGHPPAHWIWRADRRDDE